MKSVESSTRSRQVPGYSRYPAAGEALAHRNHELNSLLALLCARWLHRRRQYRWHEFSSDDLLTGYEARYCFWCSKIEIDGILSSP